jgi:hypothetical protein
MSYIPYHSGTSTPDEAERPPAAPVYEAATTTALAGRLRPLAAGRTRAAVPQRPLFRVRLRSTRFAPSHLVTIRNATDGWSRDVYGVYQDGAWRFEFDRQRYPGGLDMKFVLDRAYWMDGLNLSLPAEGEHELDESGVSFPLPAARFRHGYDNVVTEEAQGQQLDVPGDYRGDVDYDVIIVGSGVGGGILADAASDLGLRTLVLEAGSVLHRSHINNLPGDWATSPARDQVGNFVNVDGSRFLFGVHFNLGGRSVYWSGLIPRMRAWELQRWPEPVARFLVSDDGYARAERLMRASRSLGGFQKDLVGALAGRFPDFAVSEMPRSHHQPNLLPDLRLGNVLATSTGTFSTADLLLDSLLHGGSGGRENLTVNLNHLVTHIVTAGRRATAVVCQDLVGNVLRRYRARQVVLAAGSLESPRIALRSQLHDGSGKLAVGLTDHPAFFSPAFTIPAGNRWGGPEVHAKVLLQHAQASADSHPFNVELLVNPWYWDARHADDDVFHQAVNPDQPSKLRLQFNFDSPLDDGNFVRLGADPGKFEVRVQPNGRLFPFQGEVRALRDAILDFLQIPKGPGEDWLHAGNEGTPHHAGGTLRMSGDGTGVVDANLRFEQYDNLYCADLSVWPHIPAANPALTLAALARRLADHLRSQI